MFELDTTYSSKAASGFLATVREAPGPHLFWSTKSTVPLTAVSTDALRSAPAVAVRYLLRSERLLSAQGLLPPGYTPLVER